jgi:glutamine synthetase
VIPAPNSEAELIADVQANDVRLVRFLYCDPSGVIRGKSVHADRLVGKAREGVGLTRAQNAVNLFEDLVPIEGMEPVGEIRVVPDVTTYTRLPWLDGRVASVLCDQLGHDGLDWGGCARSFLKRAIVRAADQGVRVFAAFENEFYLAEQGPDGPVAWADGPVYSSAGLDRAAPVMHDITDALVAQGLVVEQVLNEYGRGQQEISIRYTDALGAADQQLKFRDTVRGVAEVGHGLLASFAPKPFADQVGSGAHLHFSLWDAAGQQNLMGDPEDPFEISRVGREFLAGVLAHLPALVALTCPSFLSYERLQPHAWAGSTVSWGYDNREAALRGRVPVQGPRVGERQRRAEGLRRVEQPVPGSRWPDPVRTRRDQSWSRAARTRPARSGEALTRAGGGEWGAAAPDQSVGRARRTRVRRRAPAGAGRVPAPFDRRSPSGGVRTRVRGRARMGPCCHLLGLLS